MAILIVDDSDLSVFLLSTWGRNVTGLITVPFSDPIHAISWCKFNLPDLILVDYIMPHLSGIEFISRVRQFKGFEAIPIVMITADESPEIKAEALDCGATDLLVKPMKFNEFAFLIYSLMSTRCPHLPVESAKAANGNHFPLGTPIEGLDCSVSNFAR